VSHPKAVHPTPEQVQDNYARFMKVCSSLAQPRRDAVLAMVDRLGERLVMCPGSSRVDYHNCFPSGLVEHSVRVVKNALALAKALNLAVDRDSVIFCALFHDIGKVGDERDDYYVPQPSSWHRDKGMLYEVNPAMRFMTTSQRSVYLLGHFGIPTTHEEYTAVLLNDGQYDEANAPYKLKESDLALLVHMADLVSTKQEKGQMQTVREEGK
jgi:putative nucleotidyltransferase with HDIG domain